NLPHTSHTHHTHTHILIQLFNMALMLCSSTLTFQLLGFMLTHCLSLPHFLPWLLAWLVIDLVVSLYGMNSVATVHCVYQCLLQLHCMLQASVFSNAITPQCLSNLSM